MDSEKNSSLLPFDIDYVKSFVMLAPGLLFTTHIMKLLISLIWKVCIITRVGMCLSSAF
jgi:hypothetical protein